MTEPERLRAMADRFEELARLHRSLAERCAALPPGGLTPKSHADFERLVQNHAKQALRSIVEEWV